MKINFGKRGLALPIAVVILMPLLLSLMFYPIAHMELKDLPFGILSLDKGAETPAGEQNLGATMVEKIESGDFAEALGAGTQAAETDESPALSSAISFKVFDSQEALDEAFANKEIYGAFVIPADFSELQVAAMLAEQAPSADTENAVSPEELAALIASALSPEDMAALAAGGITPEDMAALTADSASPEAFMAFAAKAQELGIDVSGLAAQLQSAAAASSTDDASSDTVEIEKPAISILIDYAKSPMVASQMGTGISSMLAAAPVNVEVSMINEGPAADKSGTNIMSGMVSQMIVLLPLLICSLAASVLAVLALKVRAGETVAVQVKRYGLSLVVNAISSLVLSLMLYWVLTVIVGLPVDTFSSILYLWVISFFLMTFFGGLACIRGRIAVVAGVLILLLGMTSAYLPVEGLPVFWQNWVVPWVPEYYMGNGLREVIFAGGSLWNSGTIATGIYALIGLCVALIAVAVGKKSTEHKAETAKKTSS